MALECEDLTERIIGAAIAVHRALGPGFIESVYENALIWELRKSGLQVERQKELTVWYDGQNVGHHRLDLLVENEIIVELKAVAALEDVFFAIVRSYLNAAGLRHGLILNFRKTKLEVRRVIAN